VRVVAVTPWPRGITSGLSGDGLSDLSLVVLNGIFHRHLPTIARHCDRAGIPYVVALHGVHAPPFFARNRFRKRAYFRLVERPLLQRAAAIQLLSTDHERHLRANGVTTPCVVVPNAVSAPFPRPSRASDGSAFTIGYLGRIDAWYKGLDLLIDAFPAVRQRIPTARLVLRGADAGDRPRLERLASERGIADALVFEPPDWSSTAALMRDWDLAVLPSRFDGFGLAAAEAMAAGLPVLVSTEAGIAPHIKNAACGLVVSPEPPCIADGIVELARSNRRALGERGRAYACAHLTWSAVAAGASASYRRIVDEAAA
jgi:glycosyltransferase involved in cell wall biosynthesis